MRLISVGSTWGVVGIGIGVGLALGVLLTLLMWLLQKVRSPHPQLKSYVDKIKGFFVEPGQSATFWSKRKKRFFALLIISMLFIWLSIGTSFLLSMSIAIGFLFYGTLLDDRIIDEMIKGSQRIIDRPLMSLAQDYGDHFGLYMMSLGLLILIISIIFALIRTENVLGYASFGLALLFGGVGFIAVHMGAQSDKRIVTMAALQYSENMAILSENVEQIKHSPFHTDLRSVTYHVRSVRFLSAWLESDERSRLRQLLSDLIQAIQEFKTSTKNETWEKSGYPELLSDVQNVRAIIV